MKPALVSGCVLAGGRSARMGTDKAALRLGGRTLLELQAEKLRALGLGELLISGTAVLPGARTVPDLLPDRGPLGGLHAALSAASLTCCLVLGVDVPLVPAAALRELIEAHAGGATLLACGGRTEPLIGVYDCALAAPIEVLLRAGGAPVRALLDRIPVHRVDFQGDPALLTNCNTLAEFAFAEALFGKTCGPAAEEGDPS